MSAAIPEAYPEPQCSCCGIGLDVVRAACGHLHCFICRGRGHDRQCEACRDVAQAQEAEAGARG